MNISRSLAPHPPQASPSAPVAASAAPPRAVRRSSGQPPPPARRAISRLVAPPLSLHLSPGWQGVVNRWIRDLDAQWACGPHPPRPRAGLPPGLAALCDRANWLIVFHERVEQARCEARQSVMNELLETGAMGWPAAGHGPPHPGAGLAPAVEQAMAGRFDAFAQRVCRSVDDTLRLILQPVSLPVARPLEAADLLVAQAHGIELALAMRDADQLDITEAERALHRWLDQSRQTLRALAAVAGEGDAPEAWAIRLRTARRALRQRVSSSSRRAVQQWLDNRERAAMIERWEQVGAGADLNRGLRAVHDDATILARRLGTDPGRWDAWRAATTSWVEAAADTDSPFEGLGLSVGLGSFGRALARAVPAGDRYLEEALAAIFRCFDAEPFSSQRDATVDCIASLVGDVAEALGGPARAPDAGSGGLAGEVSTAAGASPGAPAGAGLAPSASPAITLIRSGRIPEAVPGKGWLTLTEVERIVAAVPLPAGPGTRARAGSSAGSSPAGSPDRAPAVDVRPRSLSE